MAKIERRLIKMLMEDPVQRPIIPGPSLHQNLPEQTTLERCGICYQCKAPNCGMSDSCQGVGTIAIRARSRGEGAYTKEPYRVETSSIVSEATPDNLASGSEELAAQQERMTDATTKLLAMVSEVGGGPWDLSLGLTERLLADWLGEQEDRGDALKGKGDRKQEELTRMAEVKEAEFIDPFGADQGTGQAALKLDHTNGPVQGQDSRE